MHVYTEFLARMCFNLILVWVELFDSLNMGTINIIHLKAVSNEVEQL